MRNFVFTKVSRNDEKMVLSDFGENIFFDPNAKGGPLGRKNFIFVENFFFLKNVQNDEKKIKSNFGEKKFFFAPIQSCGQRKDPWVQTKIS